MKNINSNKKYNLKMLFTYLISVIVLISNISIVSFADAGGEDLDIDDGSDDSSVDQNIFEEDEEDEDGGIPQNGIEAEVVEADEDIADEDEEGISSDYIVGEVGENERKISNEADLRHFAEEVNGGMYGLNAELTKDIFVTDSDWNSIGTKDNPYVGHFNGNNHKISGIVVNTPEANYVGFFGIIGGGGIVQNLNLAESSFEGRCYVGGICAYNKGMIKKCVNESKVKGNDFVGGNVGCNEGGKVKECKNCGNIEGKESGLGTYCAVGGNVGRNEVTPIDKKRNVRAGIIERCENRGEIKGGNFIIGGNVGRNEGGIVRDCQNSGLAMGVGEGNHCTIGGNVGKNEKGGYLTGKGNEDGIITGCKNDGVIEVQIKGVWCDVGGNVGYNEGAKIEKCENNGKINCVNNGNAERRSNPGDAYSVGGNVARNDGGGIIKECKNNDESVINVKVEGTPCFVGGNVGNNEGGTVESCENYGELTMHGEVIMDREERCAIGGNVGYNGGRIENRGGIVESCRNRGSILGQGDNCAIGGNVGLNTGDMVVKGIVRRCEDIGLEMGRGENCVVGRNVGLNTIRGRVIECNFDNNGIESIGLEEGYND